MTSSIDDGARSGRSSTRVRLGRSIRRVFPILCATWVLAASAGCDFGSSLEGASCRTDGDCAPGAKCQGGYCVRSDATICPDKDDDGFSPAKTCKSTKRDCDDSDPDRAPGKKEVCDGKDNDCDGQVDEGVKKTFYRDKDLDSYGTDDDTVKGCSPPPGYVEKGGDCNDDNPEVHPGETEICNGVDDNCDGMVDNVPDAQPDGDAGRSDVGPADASGPDTSSSDVSATDVDGTDGGPTDADTTPSDTDASETGSADTDTSETGAPDAVSSDDASPTGQNSKTNCGQCGLDCTRQWDHAAEVACVDGACTLVSCERPYFDLDGDTMNGCEYKCEYYEQSGSVADEDAVCDDLDQDCDGEVDEDFEEIDRKGNACSVGKGVCRSSGMLVCNSDGDGLTCNVEPGESMGGEICDGKDNDCDGKVDNNPQPSSSTTTYYKDADEDGYGVESKPREFCNNDDVPSIWATQTGDDCAPNDRSRHPGADERCNGKDDDCDGEIDEASKCKCEFGTTRKVGNDTGACEKRTEECRGTDWVVIDPGVEETQELCDDKDNDCDGTVNDIYRCGSCPTNKEQYCGPNDTNWGSCQDARKTTESKCSDGIDNDCDGKIDSNDEDCP